MKPGLWLLITALLGIACRDRDRVSVPQSPTAAVAAGTGESPIPEPTPPQPPTRSTALPPCNRDAVALNLRGLSQPEVEARFGPPATREPFRAQDRQGELYSGIENVYPSTDPKNWNVLLEEWTWRSGDCTLTVWFHRQEEVWRALDDVYWHRSIDF